MEICKLCGKDKILIDSHIFPEFMYKPMYDENHKFNFLTTKSDGVIKQPQKGIYEKLFCQNCDNNIIGKYENHAAKIIFGDGKKKILIKETPIGFMIKGIDYKLFKLFQISLFWRASLSTRPEIKKLSLGPHAEKMRNMLLNGDPGESWEYGTVIYFSQNYTRSMKDLIVIPELIEKRIEGNRVYRAIFNGLLWTMFVSSHSKKFTFNNFFLSKEGVLPIINAGPHGDKFAEELARDLINK